MVLGLGDFNGHVQKQINGSKGIHKGNDFGDRNVEREIKQEFCDEKVLCVANAHI